MKQLPTYHLFRVPVVCRDGYYEPRGARSGLFFYNSDVKGCADEAIVATRYPRQLATRRYATPLGSIGYHDLMRVSFDLGHHFNGFRALLQYGQKEQSHVA